MRKKLLSTMPSALEERLLPPRMISAGSLGFRGIAQVLIDAGVGGLGMLTSTSKHELITIANTHGINIHKALNGQQRRSWPLRPPPRRPKPQLRQRPA